MLLSGCGRSDRQTDLNDIGNRIEMRYARNLVMSEPEPGVTLVTLRNPWDTTVNIATYALIEKDMNPTAPLPAEIVRINVPIERSVVYSGVHVSLLDELGVMEAVKGVCDTEYIQDAKIIEALKNGKIADCGNNLNPNVERIISLEPDAVLLSPYESSDATAPLARTPVNIVQTVDYMEKTPLARAEWMRFYGRLFGQGAKADSLFKAVEEDYNKLKASATKAQSRPRVIFDRIYSGVWDVPTAGSVTGNLIEDAGGVNPFDKYRQGGAARLAPEEVLMLGADADIWLVRYLEPQLTLKMLSDENTIYTKFKPYKEGRVFGANTMQTSLFEDGAFHPNLTLREMVRLLHPEIDNSELMYYKQLK